MIMSLLRQGPLLRMQSGHQELPGITPGVITGEDDKTKRGKKEKLPSQVVAQRIASCSTKLSEIASWEAKAKDSSLLCLNCVKHNFLG